MPSNSNLLPEAILAKVEQQRHESPFEYIAVLFSR